MLTFDENTRVGTAPLRCILAGVETDENLDYSMEELAGLARAAGLDVLGTLVQRLEKSHPVTYLGKGKAGELAELCRSMEADLVVTNDELSGSQLRNLEGILHCSILDRTALILDIFASRATTREGSLQVEMAQLQYRLPRLAGLGKALSRLGGGIGTRGPGEKKLETDRRHIRRRMEGIRKELALQRLQRRTRRSRSLRSGLPSVALVGYTNAGKSSIMNRLLSLEEEQGKQVPEEDRLFATLDSYRRLLHTEDGRPFLLVDTVGFVSKLPHELISAFRSTLDEALDADLLIQVVDGSFPDWDFHMGVTRRVLADLGAGDKPLLTVFNKVDLVPGFALPLHAGGEVLAVSAKTGEGFELLMERIVKNLFADQRQVELLIPFSRGDVLARLCDSFGARILSHEGEGTRLSVNLGQREREAWKDFLQSPGNS